MHIAQQPDYYAVLQVSPEATEDEIRRAYARRRRELQQQQDEAALALLLQAKTVLTDAQARRHYDSVRDYGEAAQQWYAQATKAMEDENFNAAIEMLRRILAVIPTAYSVWHDLSIAYLRSGQVVEAMKTADKLVEMAPDVALYWRTAGLIYTEAISLCGVPSGTSQLVRKCPRCDESCSVSRNKPQHDVRCSNCGYRFTIVARSRDAVCQKARQYIGKAIELDSTCAAAYTLMARTYVALGDVAGAVAWAERAIHADGTEDLQDTDDLLNLCVLYALADNEEKVRATVDRLMRLSDEDSYRRYLAARFASMTIDFARNANLQLAAVFAQCALRVFPSDENLRQGADWFLHLAKVDRERILMQADPLMPQYFKMRIHLVLLQCLPDDAISQDELKQFSLMTLARGKNSSVQQLLNGVNRAKQMYPSYYELDKEHLESIRKAVSQAQPSSAGCSVVAIAVVVLLIVLLCCL